MAALTKWSRLVATALIVGVGLSQIIFAVADWHLSDMNAYWDAAMRLREGEPLYPTLSNTEASEVYRYAPWFAWAWVPLTYLPRELVNVLWSATLLAASAAALWPFARERAWLAVAFFAPILIGISGIGNVQPLIIAALVLGVERRSGPLWIGFAASLKIVPVLFAVVYAGRRQWWRAGASVLVGGLLWAPALLYDLSGYATDPGPAGMLIQVPVLYVAVVAVGVAVTFALSRGLFGWLAGAATVCLAVPRFFVYDVTFMMVGKPYGFESEASSDAGNQRSRAVPTSRNPS